MKHITVMVLLLALLTGCGYGGEPLLLGRYFDSQDPCQRPPYPRFCGAASGPTAYVRSWPGNYITHTIRMQ
jgi:hypothetical protein